MRARVCVEMLRSRHISSRFVGCEEDEKNDERSILLISMREFRERIKQLVFNILTFSTPVFISRKSRVVIFCLFLQSILNNRRERTVVVVTVENEDIYLAE